MDAGPDQAYGCLLEPQKRCPVDARAARAPLGVAYCAFGKRRPCIRSMGERGIGTYLSSRAAIGGRSKGIEPDQTPNNRIESFDGRLTEGARSSGGTASGLERELCGGPQRSRRPGFRSKLIN